MAATRLDFPLAEGVLFLSGYPGHGHGHGHGLYIIPFLDWDWDRRSDDFICKSEIGCSVFGFLVHSASGSFGHSPILIIMNVSCSGPGDKTKV